MLYLICDTLINYYLLTYLLTWKSQLPQNGRASTLGLLSDRYTMMCDWLRFACDLGSQRKNFEHVQKPPATDYNPTFAQNPKNRACDSSPIT